MLFDRYASLNKILLTGIIGLVVTLFLVIINGLIDCLHDFPGAFLFIDGAKLLVSKLTIVFACISTVTFVFYGLYCLSKHLER